MKLENYAFFDNIVINLEQTCLIKFCEKNENEKTRYANDANKQKIIFSFNYTIKKGENTIPNSFYVEKFTKADLDFMNTEYFKNNFIEYSKKRYLNKNSIVSLRYNKDKGIIIFNLNHLHTYNKTNENGVSEKSEMPEYVYMKSSYEDFLKLTGALK